MNSQEKCSAILIGLLMVFAAPALATVKVTSFKPAVKSPEPIGKTITFTATATDTGSGPVAFQFNITPPGGKSTMVKDFLPGTNSSGTWTSPTFTWVPTGSNGTYDIEVVAKDFTSGLSATKTDKYVIQAAATGSTPVVEKTANPLVAIFNNPACATGSTVWVAYQESSGTGPLWTTNSVKCNSKTSTTFEITGMYVSTEYNMYAEVQNSKGVITDGPTVTFTTGAWPAGVPKPAFTVSVKASPTDPNPVLLHNFITFASGGSTTIYPDAATDLNGNIIWYYYSSDTTHSDVLTRPVQGGGTLTLQDDLAWDPTVTQEQYLRQIDWAGNIVRETNMGAIQQELLAMGSVDGGPCTGITKPTIGTSCIGAFHHDAIQTLPNGYMAALIDIEKIFPAGTQGDTQGSLPVDIVGDMIVVLNSNWQVVWYWDSFDPANGGQGYPQLPVTRTAPLGETCGAGQSGCPPMFLVNIPDYTEPLAHDWLHANTLYYWPSPEDNDPNGKGNIVWSSRHQDMILDVDYEDGSGTGNIIWTMAAPDDGLMPAGDFTFDNIYSDPWPWFSHQHCVGIQNGGAGPLTLFDNGNTRTADPPLGLGANCDEDGVDDCDSRGMALTVNYSTMTITPLLVVDLGAFSTAMGSADLLSNGNYFFENPIVYVSQQKSTFGFSIEYEPTPAAPQLGTNNPVMKVAGPQHYRGWQMPTLYQPPLI
jgi:arylsulfate sulfotransferase